MDPNTFVPTLPLRGSDQAEDRETSQETPSSEKDTGTSNVVKLNKDLPLVPYTEANTPDSIGIHSSESLIKNIQGDVMNTAEIARKTPPTTPPDSIRDTLPGSSPEDWTPSPQMASHLEWGFDFCLSCDRQIAKGAYCSQTCRLADIPEKPEKTEPFIRFTQSGLTFSTLSELARYRSSLGYATSRSELESYTMTRSSLERYTATRSSLTSFITARSSMASFTTARSSFASYTTARSSAASYADTRWPNAVAPAGGTDLETPLPPKDPQDGPSLLNRPEVFSSDWLSHLYKVGIIVNPMDELDWSGRGQHVEYEPNEEKHIPLRVEKVLGHSATALVESVHCRRIRLARKTIKCSRRLHKEDAIKEVQTLQRLQHQHIVRVVGTYTLKKDLSILLYPATEYNLEEFMDEAVDHLLPSPHRKALERFFGCLSTAVSFLHDNNVKHMDIKPKNLLVRNLATLNTNRRSYFRIYIADFGISRSYQSPSESETDSPTSFTRTYAAPEVVIQDKRGFSADIFSLGCVFAEMLATLLSMQGKRNERAELLKARSNDGSEYADHSYQANLKSVLKWVHSILRTDHTQNPRVPRLQVVAGWWEGAPLASFWQRIPRMLEKTPDLRPTATKLSQCSQALRCPDCESGPEPFEAAK